MVPQFDKYKNTISAKKTTSIKNQSGDIFITHRPIEVISSVKELN